MKTVLITGSVGLVGSEAVKFFCKRGFNVIGVDNNSSLSIFSGRSYFYAVEN